MDGGDVVQRLMQPLPVIEHLDVIKDRCPGFIAGPEGSMPGQFVLQVAEEAFHHRVIIRITLAAHAGDHALLVEDGPVAASRIDDALVGVVHETGLRLPVFNGHGEGGRDQRLVESLAHAPAHHPTSIEIQQDGKIKPPLTGRDEGDISHPDSIWLGYLEVPVEQVRNGRIAGAAGIGAAEAPQAAGFDPVDLP